MSRITTSHGEPVVEQRVSDLPDVPLSVLTDPDRDQRTGRFRPGNGASRRRALRRMGRQLPWLRDDQLAPWAQPYALAAREHAADLLAELGAVGPLAGPLAEEVASARLVARALLQLGLAGDMDALAEARQWLREARQGALQLEHMVRQHRAEQPRDNPLHAQILNAGSNSEVER